MNRLKKKIITYRIQAQRKVIGKSLVTQSCKSLIDELMGSKRTLPTVRKAKLVPKNAEGLIMLANHFKNLDTGSSRSNGLLSVFPYAEMRPTVHLNERSIQRDIAIEEIRYVLHYGLIRIAKDDAIKVTVFKTPPFLAMAGFDVERLTVVVGVDGKIRTAYRGSVNVISIAA